MSSPSINFEDLGAWLAAAESCGAALEQKGSEWVGPCPMPDCDSQKDAFSIKKHGDRVLISCRRCKNNLDKQGKEDRHKEFKRHLFGDAEVARAGTKRQNKKRKRRTAAFSFHLSGQNFVLEHGLCGPSEVGKFVGGLIAEEGNFCWVEEEKKVLEALPTHWKATDWELLRRKTEKKWRFLIAKAIDEAIRKDQPDDDARRQWTAIQKSFTDARTWTSPMFKGSVLNQIERLMPPPPDNEICTPAGIYRFTKSGVERRNFTSYPTKEDPIGDTFRYCLPAAPAEETVGNYSDVADPFVKLLNEWMPDGKEALYFQKIIGGALIGEIERRFLVIVAETGAGKTTWETLMRTALKRMVKFGNQELLSPRSATNPGLADLLEFGTRYLIIPEASFKHTPAQLINELTGRDPMGARRLYENEVERIPLAMPIFLGEGVPHLRGMTAGTIARQLVFTFQVPAEKDSNIIRQARDPRSDLVRAFLAWIFEGVQMWLADPDDNPPAAMQKMSRSILKAEDPLTAYLLLPAINGKSASEIAKEYNEDKSDRAKVSEVAVGRKLGELKPLVQQVRDSKTGNRTWKVVENEQEEEA